MKTRHVFLILLTLPVVLFAMPPMPYDDSKPPSLSLPAAYNLAATALGAATNQFHCVRATISTYYSPDGEWFFTFCTTNTPPKSKGVTVEFSGKVRIQDLPRVPHPVTEATPNTALEPTPTAPLSVWMV